MKRLIDLVGSMVGLVLLSPLLLAAGFFVLLDAGRPVLFRHERVGQHGKRFSVLKFRSMHHSDGGPQVTVSGDPRVTTSGKFLRRTKLDELPQLWNVLVGEMSLVGPRPEVPDVVARHANAYAPILQYRPGITDPASLRFSREEEILAAQDDPDHYYHTVLLPQKLEISAAYLERRSVTADLLVLASTVKSVVR